MISTPSNHEDPLALERQVCFALAIASRSVIGLYRPLLEPMGLTHPQYLVMLALWGRTPLSVKELSGLLALDPGTLSPLLKRLEAMGYIRRDRAVTDERQLAVTLTPTGADLRERALAIPAAVIEKLGMRIEDLQLLHASLTRVIAAAGERDITAAGERDTTAAGEKGQP
ncbi:DNA-binding MarR family transcriptional regulator [Actinokineospora baliensis]|uniref:MarR family winged helix-turn-helix transcriptional regulator n=1 Tax=Actinokineospora baliensis TaxID=547056 RepID=UPI00195BF1F2|nr:MarR family transcriptional regulator [Actinokineospora baliensis]MBM7773074.1 DNA-binding MarR family transcriptional regulator [Actinokineospora baliensis]